MLVFQKKLMIQGVLELNYLVGPKNGPSFLLIPAQMGMWESYKKITFPTIKNFPSICHRCVR